MGTKTGVSFLSLCLGVCVCVCVCVFICNMIYTKVNTIFDYNEENETKKEKIKLENRFLSIKEC